MKVVEASALSVKKVDVVVVIVAATAIVVIVISAAMNAAKGPDRLDRIAAVDGEIHSYLHVDPERTLAAARAQDASGAGDLAGVPIAYKDLLSDRKSTRLNSSH